MNPTIFVHFRKDIISFFSLASKFITVNLQLEKVAYDVRKLRLDLCLLLIIINV